MVLSYPACTVLGISGHLCTILYELIFPWILTFAIVFGLLIKSGIFKTQDTKTGRGVSGIISLAIAFFLVAFTPWGSSIGQFFVAASGTTMLFLTAILGIMLVITLISPKTVSEEFMKSWKAPVTIIVIIFVAWLIIGGAFGGGISWYYTGMMQDLVALVIILIMSCVILWFVTSSGEKDKDQKQQQ